MRRKKKQPIRSLLEFEQSMKALEHGEEIPIFEILKVDPKDYPPPQTMKMKKVKRKLRKLKRIFEKNSFLLELSEKLPVLETYRYLTEKVLFEKNNVHLAKGYTCHITGCTGNCPECFQMNYCDIFSEILVDEKLS